MNSNQINTIFLGCIFLILFAVGECLYHKARLPGNVTRQIIHIGTGLICILFPLWLTNQWYVLILCLSFAILLFLSMKYKLLPSINKIDRNSYGTLLYPLAVYISFISYTYYNNQLLFFYLPVLIMAICDPIAALVGKRFPYGRFYIRHYTKTFAGSIAFFICSMLLTAIIYHLFPVTLHLPFIEMVFLTAAVSTIAEALSYKGYDNISIPLSVILVLTLVHV